VAVYGTKAWLLAIAVEANGSHSAPDEASHTQYASPISACNHRRGPMNGSGGRIQIVRNGWGLSGLRAKTVHYERVSFS